jgi:hypothetical protein
MFTERTHLLIENIISKYYAFNYMSKVFCASFNLQYEDTLKLI